MAKVSEFPDIETVKEEAGTWLVCLDGGDLTAEEAEALREWCDRSAFHREYLHKLASNWDGMAVMAELAELFPLPAMEEQGRPHESGNTAAWRLSLRTAFVAASTIGLAAIAYVTVFDVPSPTLPPTQSVEQNYVTAIGEQRSFGLQDGSTISLNTNSRLTVEFSGSHRMVRLQQGEANFQVTEDPDRPFVVYVGTGMVWAVGTAFNVRVSSGVVDVTVTEGTVKVFADVDPKETPSLLQTNNREAAGDTVAIADAGETVQYSEAVLRTVVQVPPAALTQKLAWQQGAMIFRGEPLKDAIVEMARYTDQRLVIVDPSIEDTRIGGHFKTGDIPTLLATLDDGFGIKSERVAPNVIHLSAK